MHTKLRILHLLNDAKICGNGIVNAAIDLAAGQRELGHTVAIASAGGGYVPLLETIGIRHFLLKQRVRSAWDVLGTLSRYRQVIREFQPQFVHCHMRAGMVIARLVPTGTKLHLVSHIHNIGGRAIRLMGLAERVVCVSRSVAETAAAQGIPRKKLRIAMNGTIGSRRLPALSDCHPVPLDHPAIVTVAGLFERKGVADLITAFERAAASIPSAHLYIVGEGCDRVRFEAQSAASPFRERIHFTGFVADPRGHMLSADIFVLASHRDPCPLVILEAREAGCPVVATNVDGIPEQLDYGAAGILVPSRDPERMAGALLDLLTNDDLRRNWGERAARGSERFSIKAMAQAVLAVYEEFDSEAEMLCQAGDLGIPDRSQAE